MSLCYTPLRLKPNLTDYYISTIYLEQKGVHRWWSMSSTSNQLFLEIPDIHRSQNKQCSFMLFVQEYSVVWTGHCSCVAAFHGFFLNLPEHPVSLFVQKFLVVLAFLSVPGPKMKSKFNQFSQSYILIFNVITKPSWKSIGTQIKVPWPITVAFITLGSSSVCTRKHTHSKHTPSEA